MNISSEQALSKLQSWQAVHARLRLVVKKPEETFSTPVEVLESSPEFVTIDLGLGDSLRLDITTAEFASYDSVNILPERSC